MNLLVSKMRVIQILFVLMLVSACSPKQEEKKAVATPVNQLINLTITTPTGEQISLRELEGKNMFVFFNADCDHCQREATAIHDHLESFKDYSLYFISSDSPADQQKFARDYKLEGVPNIIFGRTEPMFIYQTVG